MGKGSARRNEDIGKIWDNWDLIFGKKDKEKDIKEEQHEEKTKKQDDSEKTK